jgi:DNA-binding SARP family transcriptional activator
VQVRLLGPVDVTVEGVARPVSGVRRKAVLAVLALHPGEIVSTGRLIDIIWGDAGPLTSANTLQSHVSHLRRVMGSRSAILAQAPGYVLDLGAEATDVEAAERLIGQAAQSSDPAESVRLLEEALAWWRGPALADVTGLAWLDEQARRLQQLWLQARKALAEASLALGEHAQVLTDLERLARDHPLDEQIHRLLMLALYRSGRQTDALAAYRGLRRALGEDLGVDPDRQLRDLEAAILRQDTALDLPATTIAATVPAAVAESVPAQLPLAAQAFAGRGAELAYLDAVLTGVGETSPAGPTAAVISAVSGTAGVGKTALAVHWAHRVADRFPDGQLYVNLRGFDPSGSVMSSEEAIRGFLDGLKVSPQRIPTGLDAKAALYRSLLAGRRILVLLDNALDAKQVRPLLPAAPGCLVLVTSRDELTGLVATEGAHPLSLDLLTHDESRQLLARRLGPDRIAGEPAAVEEIIARCARLPLALAIVAARAATHPNFRLQALAAEISDSCERLDALTGGDPTSDVRAVFSWSYRLVNPAAGRLFRLLGLHPGPDISTAAAASLAGAPAGVVRPLLTELTRAHLVTEPAPGRYTFHDLLRAYATELAEATDPHHERHAATHRALDHYTHTAHRAAGQLNPYRDPITLAAPAEGVTPERLTGHDAALAWFTAEHTVLLRMVEAAAATGFPEHTWLLAWTLPDFLNRQGHWNAWANTQQLALAAARQLADAGRQAHAHRSLGGAHTILAQYDQAESHFQQALDLHRTLGDRVGQARAHLSLGSLLDRQGDGRESLRHVQAALDLFRAAGHRYGQANALCSLGWCHAGLGEYQQALAACQESLALHREIGDRHGEAATWDSLGYTHHTIGAHDEAATCYHTALDMYRELGDRFEEATTLTNLGATHHAAGCPDAARDAWQRALTILTDLDHPDADDVRTKLHQLDPTMIV